MPEFMQKIMLIEDDTTMLSLLTILLQMEGFDVVKARELTTQAYLEDVKREKPGVVLIDVHLAQMSGLEILLAIRQDPEARNTYILMSSGMDLKQESLHAGADGFLLKPYLPDDLIKLIRESIRG